MKNGFLIGMALVAVAATAIGWLLADKRVVLIVASDSSEITVNRAPEAPVYAATAQPALKLDPIALPASELTAPAQAAASDRDLGATADTPVDAAEPESPSEPESAPSPDAASEEAPTTEDQDRSDSEPEALAEAASPSPGAVAAALVAQTSSQSATAKDAAKDEAKATTAKEAPKKPEVVYEGIGRLGHVALTAVPKKKKKGRRSSVVTPKTLYPMGQLDFDEVKLAQVMKRTDDQVLHCYREAGASRRGKVMAELTLTPEGKVQTAAVSDSTVNDRRVERCVQDLVRGLVFPKGTTNKPARVTYYWELSPSGA